MAGKLIIISGPSGVGKHTILTKLLADKSLNLTYSISATTRQPRDNEVNGKDYYFLSKPEFLAKKAQDEFLESAQYVHHYYGTLKAPVFAALNKGKNVILEIETAGAEQVFKQLNPDQYLSIFIMPPSEAALKQRLTKRSTELPEVIEARLQKARQELKFASKYQFEVINNNLEEAVLSVKKIIKNNT